MTPEEAAPAFTADADDVAIFIDAASPGVNVNPGWGQRGSLLPETDAEADEILKFSDLNYQGIDFGGSYDVSGKEHVRFDLWSETGGSVKVSAISPGAEKALDVTITGGEWNTVELDLADYSDVVDLTQVIQLKFDAQGLADGLNTFYMDNVAFAGTAPDPVDPGTGDGDGGDGDGGVSATVYDSTDILHLGNADPGSAAELTVSKTGDDQLTVMMVSADANDPIDVITHGALPAGATPSNIRVEDGVGYMDLSWAAGTMPATTSLEILWSKASFEGNWLIQPDQLGEIDTSHVASVDPGTGDGDGDGDGGTVLTSPDTAAVFTLGANDAAIYTDAPVNVTNLDPWWDQATDLTEVTDPEAGQLLKFSNFNYQGIELVEQDLSGKDDLHLDVWSATAGSIKLGVVSASSGEHLIEFNVAAGQWNPIDLAMADFAAAGIDLTDIFQVKFDTGSTVSEFYVDQPVFTAPYVAPPAFY